MVLPVATRASTAEISSTLRVVSEASCRDTRRFASEFAPDPSIPGVDPARLLFDLQRELRRGVLHAVFGLSKDSNAFLIEQAAAAHGYHSVFRAEHRYTAQGLCHRLKGSRPALDALQSRLVRAREGWAGALPDPWDLLSEDAADTACRHITVSAARPADSGGYLVSWLLRRD